MQRLNRKSRNGKEINASMVRSISNNPDRVLKKKMNVRPDYD